MGCTSLFSALYIGRYIVIAQVKVREVNRGDLALVDWLWRQKRAVALRTSAKFTTVMFLIID